MRASITALAVTLCSLATSWAGPKEDAEAQASLRLHLALQKQPPAVAVKETKSRPDYATAYYQSMKDGKPLVIHVGNFDCRDACKECLAKGACRTCDATEIFGDSTPRLILASPTGGKLLKTNEWRTVPTASQIEAAIGDCANGVCAPIQSSGPVQSFGGCANGQCAPASGYRFLRR